MSRSSFRVPEITGYVMDFASLTFRGGSRPRQVGDDGIG